MSNNKWGPPTWKLFHWMIVNIKDDYYDSRTFKYYYEYI